MSNSSFYIIGAPKCGTDTIANWLRTHSDIRLTDREADEFFYDSDREGLTSFARGRVSPWLLHSEDAIPRILANAPDARFIVCLRNPIDMAWALHSSELAAAREEIPDFSEAWNVSAQRQPKEDPKSGAVCPSINYPSACALGAQIVKLAAFVDPEQIHLVFLDDVIHSPQNVWSDLQAFLEIKEEDRSSFPIEDLLLTAPDRGFSAFRKRIRASAPAKLLRKKIAPPVRPRPVNGLPRAGCSLREMPSELRRRVCDQLSDDIGLISALSGRDLAHWLC